MTLSVWRYSHFILALVSAVFLLLASVTGIILALEPVTHQARGYWVAQAEDLPLSQVVSTLGDSFEEVLALELEPSGYLRVTALTEDFETRDLYVDPRDGSVLGVVQERPAIYRFTTNLHRSLFLKGVGRFFVGLVSLLLCVIAISGIALLLRRQGGIRKFFGRVRNDTFVMRYHVLLSRWMLVPILLIASSGVYLSAEKFNLLPNPELRPVPANESSVERGMSESGLPVLFDGIRLGEVREMEFPFSDDPEEYYLIALQDREIQVTRGTGAITSEMALPLVTLASRFSMAVHTGEGSVVWSLVLLLASASILFFMYTGFAMTLRRIRKTRVRLPLAKGDNCDVALLVGSETGATFGFARQLARALVRSGQKIFLAEMNEYSHFPRARHLIVLTATYGAGEAPSNARKFGQLLKEVEQPNAMKYSVVGFGSTDYPDFCGFAKQADEALGSLPQFEQVVPVHTVNNQSFGDFTRWVDRWASQSGLTLDVKDPGRRKPLREQSFTVQYCGPLNADETFILRLKPTRKARFRSGDLFTVRPAEGGAARQYSIANINGEIVLSIRRHEHGRCSPYLSGLRAGDRLQASIEANPHFHFPPGTGKALLISNGTGIAPFLGMLHQHGSTEVWLYWGGRTRDSATIYSEWLPRAGGADAIDEQPDPAPHIRTCYSREGTGQYVQDLLQEDAASVLETFLRGGVVMLCGSLKMQQGVLDTLEDILREQPEVLSLDDYRRNGQLRMDCY